MVSRNSLSRSILFIKIHTEDLGGSLRLQLGTVRRAGGDRAGFLFGLRRLLLLLHLGHRRGRRLGQLVAEVGLLLGSLNLVNAVVQTVLENRKNLDHKYSRQGDLKYIIKEIHQIGSDGGHCTVGAVKSFIKGSIFAVGCWLGQSWASSLASDHCQGWMDFELLKAWEPHANYAKLIAI